MLKIQRNDGISESDIIQNRFTAYLNVAVKRRRILYLTQHRRRTLEVSLEENIENLSSDIKDLLNENDLSYGFENGQLNMALDKLKERDRLILYKRAIGRESFVEIADELCVNYVTVKVLRCIKVFQL